MNKEYIRKQITYYLPGNLADHEWENLLNKIESLMAENEKKYLDWMREFSFGMASLGVGLPLELENVKEVVEAIKKAMTHPTVDSYCCACGYDIAVMNDKIKNHEK